MVSRSGIQRENLQSFNEIIAVIVRKYLLVMIPANGVSLKIFAEGGDLEGLRLLDKSNWGGRGIVCPRALFHKAKSRDEFRKPSVYILCGLAKNSAHSNRIYVGECDSPANRLCRHLKKKEFWTEIILFGAKDEAINQGHFKYLEARLLRLAKELKNAELDNNNVPAGPRLSKSDSGEANAFLDDVLLFLSCIGLHAFESKNGSKNDSKIISKDKTDLPIHSRKARSNPVKSAATGFFTLRSKCVRATGLPTANGFLVKKGSQAVKSDVPSAQNYVRKLRLSLIREGKFKMQEDVWKLTEDIVFDSPTSAAAVLL